MTAKLYTIGYTSHDLASFVAVLKQHKVTALADVRSSPYSSYSPDFSLEPLSQSLESAGIRYVFLGEELGARRVEEECYTDRKATYPAIRKLPAFRYGIERLHRGLGKFDIVLLCAEKDPITCHRTILVCREFRGEDVAIRHILEDGSIEENADTELRLLKTTGLWEPTLFDEQEALVEHAYDVQADRIAYVRRPEN